MGKECKLTHNQRMLALRMWAEGIYPQAISKEMKKRFNVDIDRSSIRSMLKIKKYQIFIKDFREAYLSKIKEVPIANKRFRIDNLERERSRLLELIEDQPKNSERSKRLYLALVAELRHVLEVGREEMENKPHLFQNVVVASGDIGDETLHRRKEELINKLRKHITRGTSGTGTDPEGTRPSVEG